MAVCPTFHEVIETEPKLMSKITRKWMQSSFSPPSLFIPRPYQHFKLFMPYQYNQRVFAILSNNPDAIQSLEVLCDLRPYFRYAERYLGTPKDFAKFLPNQEMGEPAILENTNDQEVQVNRDFRVDKLELKNLKSLIVFRDHQFLDFIQGFQLKVFISEKSKQEQLGEFLESQNELEELHMDESGSMPLFNQVKILILDHCINI